MGVHRFRIHKFRVIFHAPFLLSGEFGIVYKATLAASNKPVNSDMVVAVKTLRGNDISVFNLYTLAFHAD